MPAAGGLNVLGRKNLTVLLDASSRHSTLQVTQLNNLLGNPHKWTTGAGGQTGYGVNGSNSEQNRVSVADDPWDRTSITWRTTPDNISGADGGWNSSYYSIDTSFTYRWTVWIRRYTSETGGQFYLGMNPAPIRNDNSTVQSNPYFTYPSIASLTQNQWYLVVGHCFYQGYTGGRHPDSGWYANGVKIPDLSYGNIGMQDVRWNPGTTTAMHRAYHYYTINTLSGVEFAYPRLDKLDGFEPTVNELLTLGESGWRNVVSNTVTGYPVNGVSYTASKTLGSYSFDGTNDYVNLGTSNSWAFGENGTVEAILKPLNSTGNDRLWCVNNNSTSLDAYLNGTSYNIYMHGGTVGTTTSIVQNTWNHIIVTYSGGGIQIYVNGTPGTMTGTTTGYNITNSGTMYLGCYTDLGYNLYGEISIFKIYNRALTLQEVRQNYQQYKTRFNLS